MKLIWFFVFFYIGTLNNNDAQHIFPSHSTTKIHGTFGIWFDNFWGVNKKRLRKKMQYSSKRPHRKETALENISQS